MEKGAMTVPRKHNLLLAVAALMLLHSGLVAAADITVRADRNPAVLQESLELLFEATGGVDDDPDFAPLEQDFQILSTSVSSSMNIVGASITRTKQWRLTLMPLNTGNLIIPAISFGKDKSPQVALTVITAGSAEAGSYAPDIFMEVEASPASAYVQSQVIYTIRLYRAVATSNETLSEPVVSQGSAIIEQLDADRSYETVIRGRRYGVFERSYGVYPQVSGKLLFQPVRFQGQLSTSSPFSLDPFATPARTAVRQSEPVELQVNPVPDAYQGAYWLPATDVKITEKWSKNPLELLPDEPVTRTLTLTAEGLTASQLPEIPEMLAADFKQYPDQAVLENQQTSTGITGQRRQKNALIPLQAGAYTLPEISVPWWNTDTMSMEYAVLPERRVQVMAGASEAAISAPDLPAPDIDADVAQVPRAGTTDGTDATESPAPAGSSVWQWLSLALALAWLITIGMLLKTRRKAALVGTESGPPSTDLSTAAKAVQRACRASDPQQTKHALLQWGKARWSDSMVSSLGDLERLSDEPLASELRQLSRQLYGRADTPWQADSLWQAFLEQTETAPAKTTKQSGKLQPLFRL